RIRRPADTAALPGGEPLGAFGRGVDLLLHVADLLHGVVRRTHAVPDADQQIELLLQLGLRGLDPRILHDTQAAGLRPGPDGEPDLVAPRYRERAPRVPGPEHEALEAMRVGRTQVPHEAIQACLDLERVRRLLGPRNRTASRGVKRCRSARATSSDSCSRGVMSSSTQNARPWVAAARSWSLSVRS